MSTYSLSDGLASGAPRLSRAPLFTNWVRESGAGVAASAAWVAFGLSCLWWEDLGDWSRTHSLGIAAFVIAAFALFGTARRRLSSAPPAVSCASARPGSSRSAPS